MTDDIQALHDAITAIVQRQDLDDAERERLRVELRRLDGQINDPPHSFRDRLAGLEALQKQSAMSTPEKTGWYDNVERGFSALLKNSIGKTLAATLFIVALGFAVTLGILAFKGELDDVIRGAWTPGKEVVDVPEGTVVDEPPPGDPEVVE